MFRLLLQIYRAKYLLRRAAVQYRHLELVISSNRTNHLVRQRLGWFVDIMLSYVTSTVIGTATVEMHKSIVEAEDIDAMAEVHQKFITRLQLCGLLTKNLSPIHDSIISILDLVVVYADNQAQQLGVSNPKVRASNLGHQSRLHKDRATLYGGDSSDEEDDGGDYDADSETSSTQEESYDGCLQRIQDEFGQLLNFTVAGLRGVGRAGGESSWEMLAEKLEWGSSRVSG